MTLLTARLLGPVIDRQDWAQPHLTYMPPAMYARLVRIGHFLRGR